MYHLHARDEPQRLFERKPYQGAEPKGKWFIVDFREMRDGCEGRSIRRPENHRCLA